MTSATVSESPLYWSKLVMQMHKLDLRSELRDLLLAIARRCHWPSPDNPTKGGKAWTGQVAIAELADATRTCRSTVKRRLRALKRAGILTHKADPNDHQRHEAWIFSLNLPALKTLWAMSPIWRSTTNPMVRVLRDWTASATREKQGAATPFSRHPDGRPSSELVEDVVWGMAQNVFRAEVLRSSGGHERQVRSLARCLSQPQETWLREMELVNKAIELLATHGSQHGQHLRYALQRGRKLWHPSCWPKRVAEAQRIVDERAAAEAMQRASIEHRVVPFFGSLDLAEVLPDLQLRFGELMGDCTVYTNDDEVELVFRDVVRGAAFLELADPMLRTTRVTVVVGDARN